MAFVFTSLALASVLVLTSGCTTGDIEPVAVEAPASVDVVQAEPFSGRLALDPKWKVGDRVSYDAVKTRKRVRAAGRNLDVTSRTPLSIEVREASDDGFLLACVFGATTFDDPSQLENPLVKQMVDAFKGQTILVEVQWPGVITGVRNWQEIKANMSKASTIMLSELRKAGLDEQAISAAKESIEQMTSSREMLTQSATRELGLLLLPVGFELEGSKPLELDDSLASPFSGVPIPSKVRVSLVGVIPNPRTAVVSWTQAIDPVAAQQTIEAYVRDMATRAGKPVPDGEVIPKFEIKDVAEYRVDLATGWVTEFTHTRSMVAGTDSQIDTTSMRRSPKGDN